MKYAKHTVVINRLCLESLPDPENHGTKMSTKIYVGH